MKITDLLKEESIELNVKSESKVDILNKMIKIISDTGKIENIEEYKNKVFAREEQGTTGIGEGIAIPHGKSNVVKEPALAAVVVPSGVDFEAIDGQPVKLLFLIAAPDTKDNVHLEVLSRLSALLMDEGFRQKLIDAKTKQEFLKYIDEAEKQKYGETKQEENIQYEILCITSCPTGIAHTYMAAESLEKAGKEMGHNIKVETQGQSGVKNKLTSDEIKNAKGIIVAADTNVDLSRFNGKQLIRTKVADGIHKPKELIQDILDGKGTIYKSDIKQEQSSVEKESTARSIYKHLMNGVTHMLPFVVGGGILIAISFLLDNYEINPSGFGSNTPIATFFNNIGNVAFGFMLTVLAGYIASSIADRPGLAIGFVGRSSSTIWSNYTIF